MKRFKGYAMSVDNVMVAATSFSFAAVFLALIIGRSDSSAGDIVGAVANMTPAAKRKAQMERLDEMIRQADESIQARDLGRKTR
jgi:hypothetical protein